jgi:hypothetical protein
MYLYNSFCDAIDNGIYDEVEGAERTGLQRLNIAIEPFIVDGRITTEQQEQLHLRLLERGRRILEQRKNRGAP